MQRRSQSIWTKRKPDRWNGGYVADSYLEVAADVHIHGLLPDSVTEEFDQESV